MTEKEKSMSERRVVRVKPRSFDGDWRADLQAVGVRVPNNIRTTRYTPVNHDPMPFSVDVDLPSMRAVKMTVDVMPNALYPGHIYLWDEFCELLEERKGGCV